MKQLMNRILITGAAGAIAQTLHAGIAGVYPLLHPTDIKPMRVSAAGEEAVMGDLTDFPAVRSVMQDID
jgi:nucleoside-diphosphate-sugar epimerase